MGDLRMVPGIGAKKEQELTELGYGSLEALKSGLLEDIEAGREWHKDHL